MPASATITVRKHGATLGASDPAAAVTLTDSTHTVVGTQNTATSAPGIGTTTFTGLTPGATYTISATGTGADSTLVGTGSVTVSGTGTAAIVNYGATLVVTTKVSGRDRPRHDHGEGRRHDVDPVDDGRGHGDLREPDGRHLLRLGDL